MSSWGGSKSSAQGTGALLHRKHRPDYQIALYMGILMLLGLIIMYAIGPQRANVLNVAYGADYSHSYFFTKQIVGVVLSLGVFAALATVPFIFWKKQATNILILGFILCALLVLLGNIMHSGAAQCTLGACRWFVVGPFGTFQPAEFLKFGILLFSASFLASRIKHDLVNSLQDTIVPLGIIVLVALAVIFGIQKDMGTGLTLIAILAAQFIVAGINAKTTTVLIAAAIALIVLFIAIAPHRIQRVMTYFGASSSATADQDSDYHIRHALMAIGSGGLIGVGIGNSVEATGYLPEAINDSVFAIIGETFGLIGTIGVLVAYFALLIRLVKTSDRLADKTEQLVVVGIFGWFGSHVLLNIGAMTNIIPLTGITLPLLSFGGTSMVFMAGILGIAYRMSRYTRFSSKLRGNGNENFERRRGVGRTRDAGRRRPA